jgi:Uma2 family endonuclease
MVPQPLPRVSLADYFVQEEASEVRHEYHDGEVLEVEAASLRHQALVMKLAQELPRQLTRSDCRALLAPRTSISADGPIVYPDLVVSCGPVLTLPGDPDTLINPRLVIEVLSKSTEGYDRGRKYDLYRQIPTFAEYVCIAQNSPWILHQIRQDDGAWLTRFVTGLDATLTLTTAPVEIALADLYRDIEWEPA